MITPRHRIYVVSFVLALAASSLHATAENKLPAHKPEFLNSEQLAEWRAKKTSEFEAKKAQEVQRRSVEADVFYTGKPYLEDSGTYAFLFRSYDPELSRWTSADPSGFPDGANSSTYAPAPTSEFDLQGLKSVAWIGAETSQVDAQALLQFNASFYIIYSSMITQDSATASEPNATHYLDDGDTFSLYNISSFSALGNYSSYDQIYFVAHGNELGGLWIGSILWNTADIYSSFQNVVDVQGCIYGEMTTGEVVLNHFADPTYQFLLE